MKSSRLNKQERTTPELTAADALTIDPWDEDRWLHIATVAYYRAEARGFELEYVFEDCLAVEAEAECWDFYPECNLQGTLLSGTDDDEGR